MVCRGHMRIIPTPCVLPEKLAERSGFEFVNFTNFAMRFNAARTVAS